VKPRRPREPFLLLDGLTGWQLASADSLAVGAAVELARAPGAGRPLVDPAGTFGGFALPTGVAVDADGTVYVLDAADLALRRFDPCTSSFETLPCFGGEGSEPRRLRAPRGLAVSPRGDLVVADTGNARVQVVSAKGLVLRGLWTLGGTAWEPTDVAVAADCRVFVSDPLGSCVHVFTADGALLASFDAGGPATDIALDGAGQLYVVRRGADDVLVLDAADGAVLAHVTAPDGLAGRFCPTAVAADPDGTLHVAVAGGRVLRCGEGEARSCFCAAGEVTTLAFTPSGELIVADAGGGVTLAEPAARFETAGVLLTDALDSFLDRCTWHAVKLDADVPPGTRIAIETTTAQARPTAADLAALPDAAWTAAAEATGLAAGTDWETLVLSPAGRYLALRLRLDGDGLSTPSLAAIRVVYPRSSSIRHLPAVYRDDPLSADFLDRFLSIADAAWERIEETLDDVPAYLDPDATPAAPDDDFLSWLATWVGVAFERRWSIARRRRFLRHAHTLFRLRGTIEGIRLHVLLATDADAHVLEHFRLRRLLFLDQARLGADSELWGPALARRLQLDVFSRIGSFELRSDDDPMHDPFGDYANRFTVFVPAGRGVDAAAVERVLEQAKPAHTPATVVVAEPRLRIGTHAFVGLDTVVGAYPDGGVVEGERRLGRDAVLGPSLDEAHPPRLRVGRARVGTTTKLD
jgi:phage tail-like protein